MGERHGTLNFALHRISDLSLNVLPTSTKPLVFANKKPDLFLNPGKFQTNGASEETLTLDLFLGNDAL